MTYAIEKTQSFENDLDEVLSYYVNTLKAPQAAKSLLDSIEGACRSLESNPFLHAVSYRPVLHSRGLREILVKRYVIVYKIDGAVVTLYGFFHQRQLYDLKFLDEEGHGAT